jgi:hypothetical protein
MGSDCGNFNIEINMSNYKFKKMKKLLSQTLFLLFALMASGCASSYTTINPRGINYSAYDLQPGVSFSYKYDVLREKGNKKYAKKENNKNIKLIAVKITNQTDSVLNVSRDLVFYSGNRQVNPIEPMTIKNTLKQTVPIYLLYLLLTPLHLNVYNENTVESYSIGLFVGPGLTIGNMAVAGTANNKMYAELMEYDIMDKEIPIGGTIYGLMGIWETSYDPISVKLRNKRLL